MNAKQIAIDALEEAIEFAEKQLEKLREKLESLKGGGVTTQDGPDKDPLPPDPTHPNP